MFFAWNVIRFFYILSIVLLIVYLPIQYIPISLCLLLIGFVVEYTLFIVTTLFDEVMRI